MTKVTFMEEDMARLSREMLLYVSVGEKEWAFDKAGQKFSAAVECMFACLAVWLYGCMTGPHLSRARVVKATVPASCHTSMSDEVHLLGTSTVSFTNRGLLAAAVVQHTLPLGCPVRSVCACPCGAWASATSTCSSCTGGSAQQLCGVTCGIGYALA